MDSGQDRVKLLDCTSGNENSFFSLFCSSLKGECAVKLFIILHQTVTPIYHGLGLCRNSVKTQENRTMISHHVKYTLHIVIKAVVRIQVFSAALAGGNAHVIEV
jgi:hypothetical protein